LARILVTGATGFLGRELIRQLLAAGGGAGLRAMSRSASPEISGDGVETVRGDVTVYEDVVRAMADVTHAYHLAGLVSRRREDAAALFDVHVGGTRNVCRAALERSLEKLVVVSSSGTIAVSKAPVVHTEIAGYKPDLIGRWPYYLSKMYQEKLALDVHRRTALPLLVVNPSLLLGPGDSSGASTGDVALLASGRLPALPRGGLNFVDVRDAAAGLIGAMRDGQPGQRYLLAGVNWPLRTFARALCGTTGVPAPRLTLPPAASLAGARLLRPLYRLAGQEFPVDDVSLEMGSHFWYCDSAKAQAELGFATRDPAATLRDTAQYLRGAGASIPSRRPVC